MLIFIVLIFYVDKVWGRCGAVGSGGSAVRKGLAGGHKPGAAGPSGFGLGWFCAVGPGEVEAGRVGGVQPGSSEVRASWFCGVEPGSSEVEPPSEVPITARSAAHLLVARDGAIPEKNRTRN